MWQELAKKSTEELEDEIRALRDEHSVRGGKWHDVIRLHVYEIWSRGSTLRGIAERCGISLERLQLWAHSYSLRSYMVSLGRAEVGLVRWGTFSQFKVGKKYEPKKKEKSSDESSVSSAQAKFLQIKSSRRQR